MNHLTPEGIQAWLNTLTALITAGGTLGLLLITTIFMLIKAIKDKQKEMEMTAATTTEKVDKNAQHTAENYGTLNALSSRVDSHGAALSQQGAKLVDVATIVPPSPASTSPPASPQSHPADWTGEN